MEDGLAGKKLIPLQSSALISSREKVSTMARKLLLYLYFHNRTIFDLERLLVLLGGETKKTLEILFILEGIGLTFRISRGKFIFQGFEGMIAKFHSYLAFRKDGEPTEEKPVDPEAEGEEQGDDKRPSFQLFNKHDQVTIQDKSIPLLPYEHLAELAGELVFELLLNSQKTYPKKSIEAKFEKMLTSLKDGQSKLSLIEMQKILEAINMVDMTENPTSALWIGPDCINLTGITHANTKSTRNIEDVVVDHYRSFRQAFPYELSQRESSFFMSLYSQLTQDSKTAIDRSWFRTDPVHFQEHARVETFDRVGFAALKNKNVSYIIDKPVTIIGCSKKLKEGDFEWKVDLDLYPDPYVSKQHALILFNFQTEKFEIKCLSSTNPIKLKDRLLSEKDEPRPLEENCFIRIGKQMLWFSLMGEEENNMDELEEN